MYSRILKWALCSMLYSSVLLGSSAHASVVVNGTRVIYSGSEKEVTVKVSNPGKYPVLIQSWIDKGETEAKPEKILVPFILTPPINRVNPDKSQTLRMSYTGTPSLPADRESVFWLNVLEIPPVTKDAAPNRLQVAFRTRIKVFYRPAALANSIEAGKAAEKLSWSIENGALKVTNNSPYFVSLASVTASLGSQKSTAEADMVPPKSSQTFRLKGTSPLVSGTQIAYEYINDWGAVTAVKALL